jgi:RHS repeat-associated protein
MIAQILTDPETILGGEYKGITQEMIETGTIELHLQSFTILACPIPDLPYIEFFAIVPGTTDTIGYLSYNYSAGVTYRPPVVLSVDSFGIDTAGTYQFTFNAFKGQGKLKMYYLNEYVDTDPRLIGGLRIKSIRQSTDSLPAANDIIRTYVYEELDGTDTISSGELFFEPTYGYNFETLTLQGIGSDPNSITTSVFSSSSYTPLTGFDGRHIGYRRVVESFNGNGWKEYLFETESTPDSVLNILIPEIPTRLNVFNGKLTEEHTYRENGDILASRLLTPLRNASTYTTLPDTLFRVFTNNFSCVDGSGQSYGGTKYHYRWFQQRTGAYLLEEEKTVIDGITTTKNYTYQSNLKHLNPVSVYWENSNGELIQENTSYAHELSTADPSNDVYQYMVDSNWIGIPLKQERFVNFQLVDGTQTRFAFFNANGSNPTVTDNGTTPYVQLLERYEVTWDSIGNLQAGLWDTLLTISHIDTATGFPTQLQQRGWQPEYLTWDADNNRLTSRAYDDFLWKNTYVPGTQLLQRTTDIDGQSVHYIYDDLSRVTAISTRDAKAITTFGYHYQSPADTNNYISTTLQLSPVTGSSFTGETTREYVDGLGRPMQTVVQAHSPNQKDVITAIDYDAHGRPFKQYEPFESANNDGSLVEVPQGTPFTLTTYEASPLNRTRSVTPPDWHATTYGYGHNASSLTIAGVAYATASLKVDTITDPNGNQSITYTDRRGRQLRMFRKEGTGSGKTTTDYQYDPKDRLRRVFPPGATADSTGLIYEYIYDGRDNVLSKKTPDQGWINYVYDERKLATAMRDARMRSDGRWLHTHFDTYGRATATGFVSQGGLIDGNNEYVFADSLTRTWYDGEGIGATDSIFFGRVSRERTRILHTNDFLDMRTWYDDYGRIAETQSNHIGLLTNNQADVFSYRYDFGDKLLTTDRAHLRPDASLLSMQDSMTIDHAGRQIDHYLTIVGQQEHLSTLSYTVKDELKEKNMGGSASLQSLDYAYRDNGFLESINQGSAESDDWFSMTLYYDDTGGTTISGFAPQYNGNIAAMGWQTGTGNEQIYRYTYDFLDRLKTANLQQGGQTTNAYKTSYAYDERGNITNLSRNDVLSQASDFMTYSYTNGTNRLMAISDSGNDDGFSEGNASPTDSYDYDANGNLSHDPYKNLDIVYNYLNLPDTIIQPGTTNRIVWLYDAAGNKLRKEVLNDSIILTGPFTENQYRARFITTNGQPTALDSTVLIAQDSIVFKPGFHALPGLRLTAKIDSTIVPVDQTDYIGNIEYRNNQLQAIYHSEGRAVPDSTAWRHEYVITHYLGNTRLRFSDLDTNGIIDSTELLSTHDYYPFGLEWNAGGYQYTYNGKEKNSELGLDWLDYHNRWLDPVTGRWNAVDALADHINQLDKSPYAYAWNDPIGLNDPDGNCPLCPIIKGAAGAAVDYFIQGALNYAGGMSIDQAFSPSNIDLGDVAISGLQGALPWTVPGGKYGKAAGAALMDVGINAGKAAISGEGYTIEQAGQDFLVGFVAQLGAEKVDDFFGEGIIYLRTDNSENIKEYVGQAKSKDRYLKRQKEHARANPNSDFEFDILDRGSAKGKHLTDLDRKEQKHLDRRGGPTNKSNPNGGTSNKKNVIKRKKR